MYHGDIERERQREIEIGYGSKSLSSSLEMDGSTRRILKVGDFARGKAAAAHCAVEHVSKIARSAMIGLHPSLSDPARQARLDFSTHPKCMFSPDDGTSQLNGGQDRGLQENNENSTYIYIYIHTPV